MAADADDGQAGGAPKDADKDKSKEKDSEERAPARSTTYEDELAKESDRIRETAKWLVGTFGVVAGALITGLSLSDLGKLEGDDKIIAAIGVGVAMVGVVMVIFLASLVLSGGRVSWGDLRSDNPRARRLRKELDRNPDVYAPYDSVPEFINGVSEQWTKQSKSWLKWYEASDKVTKKEALEDYEEATEMLPTLNMLNRRFRAFAGYEQIRLTFEHYRAGIAAAALATAIGFAVFAYANTGTNSDSKAADAIPDRPVPAKLIATPTGRSNLKGFLGAGCDLSSVDVLVLDSTNDGWEVVTDPVTRSGASPCKEERFPVSRAEGHVEPKPDGLQPPDAG